VTAIQMARAVQWLSMVRSPLASRSPAGLARNVSAESVGNLHRLTLIPWPMTIVSNSFDESNATWNSSGRNAVKYEGVADCCAVSEYWLSCD
jgi:hypothetical protein